MPKDSTRGPEVNPFRLLSQAGFHASASELYKATVALVELATRIDDPRPARDLRQIIYRGGGFQP